MLRKLFKTGNSLVVSLPREVLDPLGMAEGSAVEIELDRAKWQIVIRPAVLPSAAEIEFEFARQLAEFIEEYRPALGALRGK